MTRRPVDRRSFLTLWLLGVAGAAASAPSLLRAGALDSATLPFSLALDVLGGIVASALPLAAATWVGLSLGPPVGLRTPFLDAWSDEHPAPDPRPVVAQAAGFGVAAGALILALERVAFTPAVAVGAGVGTSAGAVVLGVFAALAGAAYEEVLLRFGAMTLTVWTLWRLRPGPDGMPRPWMHRVGILLTAGAFAVARLVATAQLAALSPGAVGWALVLSGIPGTVFGWLYWKGGLESAVIAHVSAGLVLHVGGALV